MILYGITGGAGMGKSTTESILQKHGFPVVDSDKLAREVVEPGQPALEEIARIFGKDILDGEGKLRRSELSAIVFSDAKLLKVLEGILHPLIQARWREDAKNWRNAKVSRGFVSMPLLYETGAQGAFDKIICIACSKGSQLVRLKGRGWTMDSIERRNAAQMSIVRKMELSNHVIWTEGCIELVEDQLKRILTCDGACGFSQS